MKRQRQIAAPPPGLRSRGAPRLGAWTVALGIAAAVALFVMAPAAGAVTYTQGTSIPTTTEPNAWGSNDVAVDQNTGDLYVSNKYFQVAHINQAGTTLNEWYPKASWQHEEGLSGVTWDPSAEVVYVGVEEYDEEYTSIHNEILPYLSDGTPLSLEGFPIVAPHGAGFRPYNLELDQNGDIYLADRISSVIRYSHETGTPDLTLTCSDCPGRANFEIPDSVAVDSNGYIYVADQGSEANEEKGRVVKFAPDGTFDSILTEYEPLGESPTSLALGVDPTTNDVFLGLGVGSEYHIQAYNSVGEQFAEFGEGSITNPNASFGPISMGNQIAVYGQSGAVYVTDSELRVFTPDSELLAETLGSEEVGPSTATINGLVNPNGQATTECKLEYGPTAAYGASAPCATSPGSASVRTPVSADLSGLESGVEYHYRVVEKTGSGTVSGADQTFTTTLPPTPKATTGSASGVSQKAATVSGMVNPEGGVTSCEFEYGTTSSYGSSVPCAKAPGSGEEAVAVSAALSGLTAGTTYHFRLAATNASGTTHGADATFTTLADTCATNAALCPKPVESTPSVVVPPPPTEGHKATYGQCVKSANKAYKKALKKAKSKKGKARAKAVRAAKKKKQKLVNQCKARFHKKSGRRD